MNVEVWWVGFSELRIAEVGWVRWNELENVLKLGEVSLGILDLSELGGMSLRKLKLEKLGELGVVNLKNVIVG